MARLALDAGHGGNDPGAVGNGLREKDLTLYRVLKTAQILKDNYLDIEILLTRSKDETVSLQKRCELANAWGADFFLSDHTNAGGGTGFESFRLPGAYASTVQKQTVIHNEIMNFLKGYSLRDRGTKTANFYVLKNTKMPAVLIECLFIDNSKDAHLLKQQSFQDGLAGAIARGIAKALGLKPKPVSAPATTPAQLPKIAKQIAVRVDGKPVSAVGYLINNTTYLQGLFVAGLFGGKAEGHGSYINIKTK
jgi:N-acetylmuramoyl-L-alanine amidase